MQDPVLIFYILPNSMDHFYREYIFVNFFKVQKMLLVNKVYQKMKQLSHYSQVTKFQQETIITKDPTLADISADSREKHPISRSQRLRDGKIQKGRG